MKKFFLSILFLLVLIALIPMLGNKLIKDSLDVQVQKLKESGIEVREAVTGSTYLTSKIHYEFLLKDTSDFAVYLNEKSTARMSQELVRILEGAIFGVDLEYFNIPYLNNVSIDIYPLFLSKAIADDLQREDQGFYAYINKFLKKKGILYHVEYDMITEEFIGFLKDIDEKVKLKNGGTLIAQLKNTTYKGKGDLRTPLRLNTNSDLVNLVVENKLQSTSLNIQNFSSVWTMESDDSYTSDINIANALFALQDSVSDKSSLHMKNVDINVSSSVNGDKAKFDLKGSSSKLSFESQNQKVKFNGLQYDVTFSDLDKDAKEKLESLFSKSSLDKPADFIVKIEQSLISLLSKGMRMELNSFSVKDLDMDGASLGGLDLNAMLHIKQDKHIAQRINYPMMFMIKSVEFHINSQISQKIYEKIIKAKPFLIFMHFYIKKHQGRVVLNVSFKRGRFKVNGKTFPWL